MISIAMTTYNGEKYLAEQIDSILTQTISDFELIICDDCSNDSTRKILSEYATKDSRIKVIFNECNLGVVKNFEKAISFCNGEYIAFSDQDDIWLPNHLEVLLSDIQKYDCALVGATSNLIDKNGNDLNKKFSDVLCFNSFDKNTLIYRILCRSNVFSGHNLLLKSSELKKYLPIPQECMYHDIWFVFCALVNSDIYYDFTSISKYRVHEDNVSNVNEEKQELTLIQKIKRIKTKSSFDINRFIAYEELKKRELIKNKKIEKKYLHCLYFLKPYYYSRGKIKSIFYFIKLNKYWLPPKTPIRKKINQIIEILLK